MPDTKTVLVRFLFGALAGLLLAALTVLGIDEEGLPPMIPFFAACGIGTGILGVVLGDRLYRYLSALFRWL